MRFIGIRYNSGQLGRYLAEFPYGEAPAYNWKSGWIIKKVKPPKDVLVRGSVYRRTCCRSCVFAAEQRIRAEEAELDDEENDECENGESDMRTHFAVLGLSPATQDPQAYVDYLARPCRTNMLTLLDR